MVNAFIRRSGAARLILLPILLAAATLPLAGQTPWQTRDRPYSHVMPLGIDRGSAAVWQSLLKLRTWASLIMITAHPDDEDGGMLAYESRGQGARVILLTLNRGEGGQDVMSPVTGNALGVLRAEELLAADRDYGVQQYFTRVIDFGFSRSKEESWRKWGRNRVLADVVRVVRMTCPLVITSVWVGGPSDGHGQHEVAGEAAQEVFKLAADPHAFPDQIREGLEPWQALKMYARVPSFRASAKGFYDYATRHWYPAGVQDYIHNRWLPGVPSSDVSVPEGDYSPLLGLSYVQIAAEGLGMQKSQNGGVGVPFSSLRNSAYHRFAALVPVPSHETSFFSGIDTSLAGIATLVKQGDDGFLKQGLAELGHEVNKAMQNFSATRPQGIAPELAVGLRETMNLIQDVTGSAIADQAKRNVNFELRTKQVQFNNALLESLGISMRAFVVPRPGSRKSPFSFEPAATFRIAVPGQVFWVKVQVADQSGAPVVLRRIVLNVPARWIVHPIKEASGELSSNNSAEALFRVTVPHDAAFNRPYFWSANAEQAYYNIRDSRDLTLPFAPYPLSAQAGLSFRETDFHIAQVVQTVATVRGEGRVYQPLVVAPAISVSVAPHAGVIPFETKSTSLTVTVHSNVQGRATGSVRLELPAGWISSPASADFSTVRDGQNVVQTFKISCPSLKPEPYTVTAVANYAGHSYRAGYQMVGYTGLRPYPDERPAAYRTTGINLRVPPSLKVGYIMGTGDTVPQALESVGIQVPTISPQQLATGNLSEYAAIVLGIRAYAARQDVKAYNARLLAYVRNGGVLVVQYNTAGFDHDYGPYPYSLTNNPAVVVDEKSPVVILRPHSPALGWPNRIGEADFGGWIEERGHGFMASWDPRYQALLETHDPSQSPQKGGLLVARYGRGAYIYDAYALYRQLPEGVPGAYRLFVNLVSLARNPLLKAH